MTRATETLTIAALLALAVSVARAEEPPTTEPPSAPAATPPSSPTPGTPPSSPTSAASPSSPASGTPSSSPASATPSSSPTSATPPSAAPAATPTPPAPAAAIAPPAPIDIAAFPPPPLAKPQVRPPGVEVHGFAALWFIPWSEEGPGAATDAFRLRFAVLRVDARPAPKVTVLARLGLMLPDSPLLDFAATYHAHPLVGVTAGQFRLPIGAAATTLAPNLVMLDRPRYVYQMTKLAFRDIGVMVHSPPAGLARGVVHYRLALASGSGRLGSGIDRPPEQTEYLVAGRVLVDAGRVIGGPQDRLVAGASYLRSRDPAIATGDLAADRALAVNTLGRTLVPFGEKRVTHLAGADLTLARGPIWAQAELLYLTSSATDGDAERAALGASLEAAYTLPVRLPVALQLAARGEHFDPNRDVDDDAQAIGSLGVNASTPRMRWSAFASVTRFEDASTDERRHAGELALRMATTF